MAKKAKQDSDQRKLARWLASKQRVEDDYRALRRGRLLSGLSRVIHKLEDHEMAAIEPIIHEAIGRDVMSRVRVEARSRRG